MLISVGTNHKYSSIEIRGKLSFSQKALRPSLMKLLAYDEVKGGVILSTCNRTELYVDSPNSNNGIRRLKEFLAYKFAGDRYCIDPHLYTYIDKEAMIHLCEVASGLDSQIIGEVQILQQVQSAYKMAREVECTNALLDNIFDIALRVAARIREETGIAKGNVSIANVVKRLVLQTYDSIHDKKILIIGVGKISELLITYLKQEDVETVFIANRTYEKAARIASLLGAEVVRFDRLKEKLEEADIIITATASPHPILRKDDILGVEKPLLIIDLAVPRNVDPEIKDRKEINLFCLDDLDAVIEDNLKARRESIPLAKEIIRKEIDDLYAPTLKEAGEPCII